MTLCVIKGVKLWPFSCVPISYKSIPFYCVSHLHIYPFIVLVVWFMFTRNIVRIEMMVCRLSFSNWVYTYEKKSEKLPRGAKILEKFDKFRDFGVRSAENFLISTNNVRFYMYFIRLIGQSNIVPFFAILHNIVPWGGENTLLLCFYDHTCYRICRSGPPGSVPL